MVGNFIGDFVKGKKYEEFEQEIARGVLLHRSIDGYTDQHPVVSKSKARLRNKYRHYAGVIVDVAYDHFLAGNWNDYHPKDLLTYTEQLYTTLDFYHSILPERMKFVLRYMKRDNWLLHYSQLEGINRALTGMSQRTKFDSKMDEATRDLQKDYLLFLEEFKLFIPDVKAFVADWLKKGNNPN